MRVAGYTGTNDMYNGLFYLYTDHLGSASAMQKSDGTTLPTTRYTPFGNLRNGNGFAPFTDRDFTGQRENRELGLLYYQARYYLPGIGRFASADTLVPDPQNPQQFNRYTYSLNSPLRDKDPTGHCGADALETLTEQCILLRDNLHEQYEVNILGIWTLNEMQILGLGLGDIAAGFDGLEYFVAAFRGTNLSRERIWQGLQREEAITTLNGDVTFYNAAFSRGQDWGRWAVVHEFGHVWDYRGIDGWSNFWEQADTVWNMLTKPSNLMKLFTERGRVSTYAGQSVGEDFAESWASYFFQGSWENMVNIPGIAPRTPANQARSAFIGLQVSSFQSRVDLARFAIEHPILYGLGQAYH